MTADEVSSDEAAAVFRRAAELDQRQRPGDGHALDVAALEHAGMEAGLSRDSIRQALAEIRAGTPVPQQPDAVVARTVGGGAMAVEQEVERFMRQQNFRVMRRLEDRTMWMPDRSMWGNLRRTLDFSRRIVVREVSQATTCVVAVPGSRDLAHVRFELDLGRARRGWYSLPIAAGVMSVGGVAALAVLGVDPALAIVAAPGAVAVTGGVYAGARAGYRGSIRRSVNGIERFLDHLEHGR